MIVYDTIASSAKDRIYVHMAYNDQIVSPVMGQEFVNTNDEDLFARNAQAQASARTIGDVPDARIATVQAFVNIRLSVTGVRFAAPISAKVAACTS